MHTHIHLCLHLTLVTKQYHLFYLNISQYLCSLYDFKMLPFICSLFILCAGLSCYCCFCNQFSHVRLFATSCSTPGFPACHIKAQSKFSLGLSFSQEMIVSVCSFSCESECKLLLLLIYSLALFFSSSFQILPCPRQPVFCPLTHPFPLD